MSDAIDIARLIRQIPTQYPFVLVDRVLEHDPAGRLVAIKNVTGSEEFFEGHFPGAPVMPGVLLMESLAQAAGIWLLQGRPRPAAGSRSTWSASTSAKFRRPAVPGDQLRLEVQVLHRRGRAVPRARRGALGRAPRGGGAPAAAGRRRCPRPRSTPPRAWRPGAVLGPGVRVGPYCVIGPRGADRRAAPSSTRTW